MVDTDALGASAFSVGVRVPPPVQQGVIAQAEYSYDTPMVEQVREKDCAAWFKSRSHHKLNLDVHKEVTIQV
jgi:hypothetical protein